MANIYDILIVYKRWARWKWFCGLALAFILDKCNLEKVEEILDIVALNKMKQKIIQH